MEVVNVKGDFGAKNYGRAWFLMVIIGRGCLCNKVCDNTMMMMVLRMVMRVMMIMMMRKKKTMLTMMEKYLIELSNIFNSILKPAPTLIRIEQKINAKMFQKDEITAYHCCG